MIRMVLSLVCAWLVLGYPALCAAHFGMVIPSSSMVDQDSRDLDLTMSFSHPFDQEGMELAKPLHAGVFLDGTMTDLAQALEKTTVFGHTAWSVNYRVKRPGVYTFVMEPQPYWEPAEDCFIVHYTKTIVGAFGHEEGWERPVGLKTEIVPLTRPFGLYAGNVFQGLVLLDGKPAPHTPVEIEYYHARGHAPAPHPYLVTQVVRADANGVFTFGIPAAGWWGFAGLNTAQERIQHDGTSKEVEVGAVLWVEALAWPEP